MCGVGADAERSGIQHGFISCRNLLLAHFFCKADGDADAEVIASHRTEHTLAFGDEQGLQRGIGIAGTAAQSFADGGGP